MHDPRAHLDAALIPDCAGGECCGGRWRCWGALRRWPALGSLGGRFGCDAPPDSWHEQSHSNDQQKQHGCRDDASNGRSRQAPSAAAAAAARAVGVDISRGEGRRPLLAGGRLGKVKARHGARLGRKCRLDW